MARHVRRGRGQAPVFYNLLVAGAAVPTLRATVDTARKGPSFALGAAAMLLAGIAIQIKYTVVFEGVFVGLALVWRFGAMVLPPRGSAPPARSTRRSACPPTLAALGWYAAHGHIAAFIYANFASIANRAGAAPRQIVLRLLF